MHHIITDGWSMSILFDEIGALYAELTCGMPAQLPALPIQYADFATSQRAQLTAEFWQPHVTFWTEKLQGHSGFVLLPTDRPRPSVQSHEGAIESFQVEEQLARALARLAQGRGGTLFMVLLAALQTLVWRYRG
jgi:hypothetical protein